MSLCRKLLQLAIVASTALAVASTAQAASFFGDDLLTSETGPRKIRSFFVGEVDAVVTNESSKTVAGPIRLSVDVTRFIFNADGIGEDGLPFIEVCHDCSLEPGESEVVTISYLRAFFFRLLFGKRIPFDLDVEAKYLPFTLQLLHNADVDGVGPLANVRNFSGVLDRLRDEMPEQTLYVSSGDNWIPGPTYAFGSDPSLAPVLGIPGIGRGDIAFFNAMGGQASAVGNHELDQGLGAFASIIDGETDGVSTWEGAQFPYLSSNIDFSGTVVDSLIVDDGLPAQPNSVAESAVVEVDGEPIGLVGVASPTFPVITSPEDAVVTPPTAPDGSFDLDALVAEIQAAVDVLTAGGVDKVIVLAHMQQLDVERSFAPLLENVDAVIGGGSNTILVDETDLLRAGDTAGGTYPELYDGASGQTVALVNTDGDYKYLGRLVVSFDLSGNIIPASLDTAVNGAYATDEESLIATFGTVPPANAEVVEIADALTDVLIANEGNVLGFTDVYLDGRRATVRTQEANLGNLTADANLAEAQAFDATVVLSLKNGGGIRDDIGEIVFPPGSSNPEDVAFTPPAEIPGIKPAGGISQLDITNTLRFNNTLTLLNLSGGELKAVFEHAVAFDVVGVSQQGRFPQIAGARFSFDTTLPIGSRVVDLGLVDAAGFVTESIVSGGAVVGAGPYRIVTLNFLAGGGDGFPFPPLDAPGVDSVDLTTVGLPAGASEFADAGSEQDALAEYLQANFATPATAYDEAEVPVDQDGRVIFVTLPQP